MHFRIALFLLFSSFMLYSSFCLFAEIGFCPPWGKDADLKIEAVKPAPHSQLKPSIMATIAEQIILFHQNVISPVDGPRSHFRPTSSRYMLLAIRKHGFMKGFVMGCDRLLRENEDPWIYRTVELDGKTYKWDPVK